MKRVLCSLLLCLLITGTGFTVMAQAGTDSILTTKGAVTLITSGAPISTFQIGDGKNTDYDYRIVDGNMVFLRPVTATPRPTNLIVREGENIHYMIIAFRDKVDLARLKYTLSGKVRTTGAITTPEAAPQEPRAGRGERLSDDLANLPEESGVSLISVDTVTVGKIADDFGHDHKVNHQYEVKVDGVSVGYAQAMTLNKLNYFSFRIRNKGKEPFEIVKASLLHKEKKDTSLLHTMPILYRKGPSVIAPKEEASEVYVVPSKQFRKEDEVIVVLQTTEGKQQLVLYIPVTVLPKYMLAKQ
ncbi:hypothetical protein FHW36_106115 [Chitinophaga polysaccharea]|uniref:DUF4138 domain-containing protein n=1 Tax=Chitinophaga polysaccharea TaxID=1293035 RepID=A0A561PLA7_9BACT|nr:hypothetical protein [Chitinophaga polysaccharea]TWF38892.1 hypothetical protein FHW36_106115 [Chitinophaga polysaccharea]